MSVKGTPWQIAGHILGDESEEKKSDIEESAIPDRAPEEIPTPEPMIEAMPARMRILQKDLHIHGYTPGCIGCRQVLTGVKKIQAHTELCRARMYPLMRAAEGSKSRAEEAEQKKQDWERRASELEAQESVKRRKTGRGSEWDLIDHKREKRDITRDDEPHIEPEAKRAKAREGLDNRTEEGKELDDFIAGEDDHLFCDTYDDDGGNPTCSGSQ